MRQIERDGAAAMDTFINKLREKLEFCATYDQGQANFTTLFVRDLADMLEDARDALSGQHESDAATVPRGMSPLPTHDELREKRYAGAADALEILLFDLQVDNPQRAEAFRALLEGRPPVPDDEDRKALAELLAGLLQGVGARCPDSRQRNHGIAPSAQGEQHE